MNKWIALVFGLGMVAGLAVGLSGWQAASIPIKVDMAAALFFSGLLLLGLWHWNRAEPGSADRQFLPTIMLLSAAQLLFFLPRLIWPDDGWLRASGYFLAISVSIGLLIRQGRRFKSSRLRSR